MSISPRKLNLFLLFKLPSAYLCGIRTKSLSASTCIVKVKHRWINQNPFNSMFWAVQGMAAELTTGALVMSKIKASGKPISMLVVKNDAVFTKKATGRITFTCDQGELIDNAIERTLESGEGQIVPLNSKGVNEDGIQVSQFNFEWTIKLKS